MKAIAFAALFALLAAPALAQSAEPCPDDGPRLPGSGICTGRAVNYLDNPPADLPFEPGKAGCDWVVKEAEMPGGWLLYLAAKCGDQVGTLEWAGGADHGELWLLSGPYGGRPEQALAYAFDPAESAARSMIGHALEWAGGEDTEGCRVVPDVMNPEHFQIDNVAPDEAPAADAAAGGPRAVCGPLGLDQDSSDYWTLTGDMLMFVMPEIGLYQSVDTESWALVPGQPQ